MFSQLLSHLTTATSASEVKIITRKLDLRRNSLDVPNVAVQVMSLHINKHDPSIISRPPNVSPVHSQHADQREEIPLAVHRVQDLHPVRNL